MVPFSTRRSAPAALIFAALLALGLAGCETPPFYDSAHRGPFYTPVNHKGDAQMPASLRRVVLLPVAGGSVASAESAEALNPVFLAELQKQNRFEIVTLTREECLHRFRVEEFLSTAALPTDFLARLRRDHGADAVMFVDVTVYKPYRPLALGVRAKLATLDADVRLVWTFDNVFSAADPAVANSARHHFLDSDRGRIPADLTPAVLQSPTRFATYVAAEMFATLPPVVLLPVVPAKADASVADQR